MNDLKSLIIFLSQYDLTSSKMEQIIDFIGENPSISSFKRAKLDKNNILSSENYAKMISQADDSLVRTYTMNLENRGIKIVTKFEENYPKKLFDLPEAPLILYYMGDLSLVNSATLSVVGTRKPSIYGRITTEKLVRDVASAGVTIVSGLAYGVDSIAHKICLECGGKTIAVLGGGFDHVYPTEHYNLAMEIAEKGLLISEYRPKKSATKYSFPQRNRIVAGLGDGVLITEAGIKSGTIHTKDFALEYGRNIYSVPGNIDSISSQLTNEIIKTGQAVCTTQSEDILKDYDLTCKQEQGGFFDVLSENEQNIVKILKNGMISMEDLTKNCTLSVNILNTCLTTLEIRGIIRRLPGGNIALN